MTHPVQQTDSAELTVEQALERLVIYTAMEDGQLAMNCERIVKAALSAQAGHAQRYDQQNPSVDADLLEALNLIGRNNSRYSILCPDGEYRAADDIARSAIARAESSQGVESARPVFKIGQRVSVNGRAGAVSMLPYASSQVGVDFEDGGSEFVFFDQVQASQGVDASLVEDLGAGTGSPTSRRGSLVPGRSGDA